MVSWHKYPFVRMLFPLVAGVGTALYAGQLLAVSYILIISVVLLVLCTVLSLTLKSYRLRWVFGAVLNVLLFFLGAGMVSVRNDNISSHDVLKLEDKPQAYVARLWEYSTERENSYKVILDLRYAVCDSSELRPVKGRVMTYFAKTDTAFDLNYGDMIMFYTQPEYVAAPSNPYEFDYRQYLFRKGVLHQLYLRDDSWVSLKHNKTNPIYNLSYKLRDRLLRSLRECGIEGDEYGVAAAILLGYDDSLPYALRQDYVAAGSMHILCVSGMHVGVLFLLLSFVLGFLKSGKWQNLVRQVILLAIIWIYAFVCGLSPSILRATFMLTFVVVGDMLNRKGFALNTIAASAFILLSINPYNLLDLGFILSYSAVVGIVFLQKPIYNLVYIKNKRLDYLWEITSVALAAQLATAPFTIFFFHQFPVYFWLANLVLTPLSSVIIVGGMVLIMLSFVPYVNIALGWIVSSLIYVMNAIVNWIEGLPFSMVKGLYLSDFEFVLFVLAVALLMVFVRMKSKKVLFAMLAVSLALFVSMDLRVRENSRQVTMNVYSMKKHTAVEFVCGYDHIVLCDSALIDDEFSVKYAMEGNWVHSGLSSAPAYYALESDIDDVPFARKRGNLISFAGMVIVLWDNNFVCGDSLPYRIPVDYVLVTGNRKPDAAAVLNCYDVSMVVVDGSVSAKNTEKWENELKKMSVSCYPVREKGALVLNR